MKKIVALGAIAALACGMVFADEPAIDIKVAELSGEASVKWGVDLDAGQHGFSNSNKATLKVNLWNEGTKETTSDDAIGGGDVWAEIQVKGKAAAYKNDASAKSTDLAKNLDGDACATLEKAMIHFGPNFYVNIKSGDLQVGEYKPDTALVADKAWISKYGYGWSNGIEAGYDADAFKFSVDFRSYKATATDYTSAYGFKLGAELKDNLVPGLTAAAGFGMNLSTDYKDAEATGVEGYTDKKDNLAKHQAKILDWDSTPAKNTDHAFTKDVSITDGKDTVSLKNKIKNYHGMTYSAKAAYKLAIGDDGMYLKPSVGFQGNYQSGTIIKGVIGTEEKAYTGNWNNLAFGVLFGWGEMKDAAAGVPFLNDNGEKKVTPGISVAAYIPLPTTVTAGEYKNVSYDKLAAVIVPSFYLGEDKVEGLKAAAYSEIGIYNYIKEANDRTKVDGKTVTLRGSAKENETFAFALAAGLAYGIKVEDYTITPKAGFRFVNGAYVNNGLAGSYSNIFKTDLGFQSMKKEGKDDRDKQTFKADFFNLKIGCDFAGFINNTTFSVNYNSANLLNAIGTEDTDPTYVKDTKYYNVKAGQLDVGCKISL